jgi:hypothetical protein
VQETLRRLAGQQIAVINLHTLPDGYLGLRLAWTTQLMPRDNSDKEQTYSTNLPIPNTQYPIPDPQSFTISGK